MEFKSAVVTGANKGIGLALTREFRARGFRPVVATFRDSGRSTDLLALARKDDGVVPLELDVANYASVATFGKACGAMVPKLHILVNNAGVPSCPLPIHLASMEDLEEQFQVHALGMLRVTKVLLPLLQPGGVIANISSVLGSMDGIGSGYPGYAPAKAAQNAITLQLCASLRSSRIAVLAIHPGWVRTSIGGRGAPVHPEASAAGLADRILDASIADSGTFQDYLGRPIPW